MVAPQPLIIDHFAGGGGASTGISLALGRHPDIAINHCATAIEIHKANHPTTQHYQESVWDVDPMEATQGRPVDLMWMSPSCTHFSGARGGTPVNRQLRALAWVGVRWAAAVKPTVIVLENVRDFATWGPLIKTPRGLQPDPRRKGKTFKQFVAALENLGYVVEWLLLDSADYGAPTRRVRLFMIARRDGHPIVWPQPSHPTPVPVQTVLDLANLGEPAEGRQVRPLGPVTLRKSREVLQRFGVEVDGKIAAIMQYNGRASEEARGLSITGPLRTLTTANRFALVQQARDGTLYHRFLTTAEQAGAMGFPADYRFPCDPTPAMKAIGNSVCPPVAAAVVRAVMTPPVHANAAD